MNPAYWPFIFYLLGCLCFMIGTLIAMGQVA